MLTTHSVGGKMDKKRLTHDDLLTIRERHDLYWYHALLGWCESFTPSVARELYKIIENLSGNDLIDNDLKDKYSADDIANLLQIIDDLYDGDATLNPDSEYNFAQQMKSIFETEIETFNASLPLLMPGHKNQFVVIKGNRVIAIEEDYHNALSKGYNEFGLDEMFFVREIKHHSPQLITRMLGL